MISDKNKQHLSRLLIFFIAAIIALGSYKLIHQDTLSRAVKADLLLETNRDVFIKLKQSNALFNNEFDQWDESLTVPLYAGKERWISLNLFNRISPGLALEMSSAAKVEIKQITFRSYYADPIQFKGAKLQKLITNNPETPIILSNEKAVTVVNNERGFAVFFNHPVVFKQRFLSIGLPILIFLLSFILLRNINYSKIGAIYDLNNRETVSSRYRIELDGLRGLAAIMVLFEHTLDGAFLGFGRTGVLIFFILSGYLLSQPFVRDPKKILESKFLSRYMLRRVLRIVPMYYVTVLIMFGFTGKTDRLFNHFIFTHAESHLWTIPQEMFFYVALPFIMLSVYLLAKISKSAMVIGLMLATLVFIFKPDIAPFSLYALGNITAPLIGWFMLGIVVAFLNPESDKWRVRLKPGRQKGVAYFGMFAFILLMLFSTTYFNGDVLGISTKVKLPITYGAYYGIAIAVILFCLLATENKVLNKILSLRIFRMVGIVGFSFYLLHPIVGKLATGMIDLYIGKAITGIYPLLITGILTYAVSVLTYSLIERPFMLHFGKKRQVDLK